MIKQISNKYEIIIPNGCRFAVVDKGQIAGLDKLNLENVTDGEIDIYSDEEKRTIKGKYNVFSGELPYVSPENKIINENFVIFEKWED